MSALDAAIAELEARRARDDAERNARRRASSAFLKAFFEADVAPSRKLSERGIEAAFDGTRLLLRRPEEGVYADGLAIVVGEQGEIDVGGRSLGPVTADGEAARRKELIAEIISHFSL